MSIEDIKTKRGSFLVFIMNIRHENILLRAIEITDLVILHQMANDESIEQMLGGWSFPVSFERQKNWYDSLKNETNILRCIIDVDDLGVAGTVILSDIDWKNRNAQIHIKIVNDEKFRRKGLGQKAISAMVRYAFHELNLHCVFANILEGNLPSQNMFNKCGFILEGRQKHRVFKSGMYKDMLIMSIFNEE